jgi:hypothetical protein
MHRARARTLAARRSSGPAVEHARFAPAVASDCLRVLWVAAGQFKNGVWAAVSYGFGIDIGFNNIKVE